MKKIDYIPKSGDIVWMDFDPAEGHEQKGHRPGLVVSAKEFSKTGFAIVCPITSRFKPYPTRIPLDARTKTNGLILCEQVKSLDYRARHLKLIEELPSDILEEVMDCVMSFFIED